MSTNINPNVLKNFIVKTLGSDRILEKQAQNKGIDADKFEEANRDENCYLDLNEIVQDQDLYNQFAVMYANEQDKKAEAKNKEEEKAEQTQVKDKNGAGV